MQIISDFDQCNLFFGNYDKVKHHPPLSSHSCKCWGRSTTELAQKNCAFADVERRNAPEGSEMTHIYQLDSVG